MAGAACKIIIDETMRGLMRGLERVLLSPLVRDKMIPAAECDRLIQTMADIELSAYSGLVATDKVIPGLVDILKDLEEYGVITKEVWGLLHRTPD